MRKTNPLRALSIALTIFMILSMCSCRRSQDGKTNSKSDKTQRKTTKSEDLIDSDQSEIDGFEKAEYEKFNSYAKDNGLGGTLIYFDGIAGNVKYASSDLSVPGGNSYYLSVFQLDGKEWLVWFPEEPITDKEELDSLLGKSVRVYGAYTGLSNEYQKPSVEILEDNCRIEDLKKGKDYEASDFSNDVDTLITWCDENGSEMSVENITKPENERKFCWSTGIVDSIAFEDSLLRMYTKSEKDSLVRYDFWTGRKLVNIYDVISLDDLNYGDKIKVYYFINSDMNPYPFAIEKVSDVGFEQAEIFSSIQAECIEYTYEEMARNPDKMKGKKVKLSGIVIDVAEHENVIGILAYLSNSGGGYSSNTVYIEYTQKTADEDRILENDVITVYGTLNGLFTYTAVSGAEFSPPFIDGEYIVRE